MCKITNLLEPDYLILTWRGPGKEDGNFAVAKLERLGNNEYAFSYLLEEKSFQDALERGFQYLPAFKDIQKRYTTNVIDFFAYRMPPRARGDFKKYLEQIGLDPEINLDDVSDFALLAYSGAKLATDNFQLVNPLNTIKPPCKLILEAMGCRHHKHKRPQAGIQVNDVVQLVKEPDCKYDKNAVNIQIDGKVIAYVNRIQAEAIGRCLKDYKVSAHVYKTNGTEERPRLFICVEIKNNLS